MEKSRTSHPLSHSTELEKPRLKCREKSEATIVVPKIIYESSSDSSEDLEIAELQKKYL